MSSRHLPRSLLELHTAASKKSERRRYVSYLQRRHSSFRRRRAGTGETPLLTSNISSCERYGFVCHKVFWVVLFDKEGKFENPISEWISISATKKLKIHIPAPIQIANQCVTTKKGTKWRVVKEKGEILIQSKEIWLSLSLLVSRSGQPIDYGMQKQLLRSSNPWDCCIIHNLRFIACNLAFCSSSNDPWSESVKVPSPEISSDSHNSLPNTMHRTSGSDMRCASIVYSVPSLVVLLYLYFRCSDLPIVQPLARSWYVIWYNVLIIRQSLVSKIVFGVLIGLFHGYVHVQTFGGIADKLHMVC